MPREYADTPHQHPDLDAPSTFFEDAIEALENAQASWRVEEIRAKAQNMSGLAMRLCDRALHAEAEMIARLAAERLAALPLSAPIKRPETEYHQKCAKSSNQ